MGSLSFHPLSELFPSMSEGEYEQLVTDIKQNGQREPIWLHNGQILDGRHRYRACLDLGREPLTRTYDGDDPTGFVVSLNLHRRHLSESQRALVAKKLANLPHGRRADYAGSRPANLPVCHDGTPAPVQPVTQKQAARLLNVSERIVRQAGVVLEMGAPEVQQAVERGEVSVSAAAQFAKQEPCEQADQIKAAGDARSAVSEFRKRLPTKQEARKIAAKTGSAVLGKDGHFHTDASDEERAREESYLQIAGTLRTIRDLELSPEEVVASVPSHSSALFGRLINETTEFLCSVQTAWTLRCEA